MSEYSAKLKFTSTPFHIKTTISFPLSKRVSRFLLQGILKFYNKDSLYLLQRSSSLRAISISCVRVIGLRMWPIDSEQYYGYLVLFL
jgi:hypothetical protein